MRLCMSILIIVSSITLVGCEKKYMNNEPVENAERIEASQPESLKPTQEAQKQNGSWSVKDAESYYDTLKHKMVKLNTKERGMEIIDYCFTFKEFESYLLSQGIGKPIGFTPELPGVTEDQSEKVVSNAVQFGYMKKTENGGYELCGSLWRAMLPVIEPYAYLKSADVVGERFWTYYFHDTYVSMLYTEKGSNAERTPEYEDDNHVWILYDEIPGVFWCPIEGDARDFKYTLVNCITGEETEFVPEEKMTKLEVKKKVQSMYEDALKQSEEVKRNLRKEMIYNSIQSIIDRVQTDTATSMRIYEDLCWAVWRDIRSIDGYEKETGTLRFSDMYGKEYIGYLNDVNNLWKVTDSNGETVFQDESEGNRTMSFAELSMMTGDE